MAPQQRTIRDERVELETALCQRIEDDMYAHDSESLRKHLKQLKVIFEGKRPEPEA